MTSELIANNWQKFVSAKAGRKFGMIKELFFLVAFKFLGIFICVGLQLLSRGRPVRIGTLNKKGKLSIMVSYIEPYLRQLQIDSVQNPFIVLINPGMCPNEQLSKMYGRAAWLLDDRSPRLRKVFSVIYRILWRTGSQMAVTLQGSSMGPFAHAWQEGKPILRFSKEEIKAGRSILEELGIPLGAPYVCLGIRESEFYEEVLREAVVSGRHEDRELEREFEETAYIRNPQLEDFIPMATECAEQGFYVLRMGQVVGRSIPSGLHPNILDYAKTNRSPFGDIYLLASCKFVVSGTAGLWWVSAAFNRPTVITDNYHMYLRPPRKEDLFIPSKLFLIEEKRLFTFREMMELCDYYSYESYCIRDGVQLVHNTPEEIADVVLEMNHRLDGTWQSSDEDEELQRRFDALYEPHHIGYGLSSRIGAEFLRQHADLL